MFTILRYYLKLTINVSKQIRSSITISCELYSIHLPEKKSDLNRRKTAKNLYQLMNKKMQNFIETDRVEYEYCFIYYFLFFVRVEDGYTLDNNMCLLYSILR